LKNTEDYVYEQALRAINKMFSDCLVSKDETIQRLQSLRDEIDIMMDSLKD